MKSRNQFLNPVSKLIDNSSFSLENNDFWYYILYSLFQESNHTDELDLFFEKSPLFSSKFKDAVGFKPRFSLNESLSSSYLTPFHLSLFQFDTDSKSKGQFFTPKPISEFIITKSIKYVLKDRSREAGSSNLESLRYADIACGTGNLLIPLLTNLYEIFLQNEENKNGNFLELVSKNIYCFDIDPNAVWISKLRTLLFLSNYFPDKSLPTELNNFQIGNSLIDPEFIKQRFSEEEEFQTPLKGFYKPIPLLSKNNLSFDLILSNPPYMCYGLRNAQRYQADFKKYLRDRFVSAEYKLSLYSIFMERSIELLDYLGILGIITPDSHLLGRYYSKIRDYLLNNSEILDISLLGFEPFRNVTLGRPTISFFKKIENEKKTEKRDAFIVRWIPDIESLDAKNWEEHTNFQSKFSSYPHNRFHLLFNHQDEKFISDWKNRSKCSISDIASIHTGVRSKVGKNNIISKSNKGKTWKRGIISGSQVNSFFVDYRGDWIDINPTILWSGGFEKDIIENPKILIRQTGFQIITSVDIEGYYHLNNCHSLSPKEKEFNLYALSVVLNSDEFRTAYHIMSMEKGRALAQVDIEFLLKMQIPLLDDSQEKILENFYFKQMKIMKAKVKSMNYSLFDLIDL